MSRRYIFVGNRRFVLEEMIKRDAGPLDIIAVRGSHLHRDLEKKLISAPYRVVDNKQALISLLGELSYDVLISNGCPYILPIAELPAAIYANIHPSYLPDLRGIDPVIGSILNARDAGATCHIMDSGIDSGQIISQIKIPYTEDLDVTTLYQLSFIAERRVYNSALDLHFVPQFNQNESPHDIYFNRKPSDKLITFQESNSLLLRKIRAFNNRSQGCEFNVGSRSFRVFEAMRIYNPFIVDLSMQKKEGVILLSYEDSIIFRKDGEIIRFMNIISNHNHCLQVGDQLF